MKRFLLVILCMFVLTAVRAQMLGLKTNLLKDGACMPNVSLEIATGSRTTLSTEIFGSVKSWGHRFKTVGVAPELRWWFGGRTFSRFFLGVGAKGMHYDIAWKGENYRGDAAGMGLTFGYDFYLGRHFSLDISAGTGAMAYWQKHSKEGDTEVPLTYSEKGIAVVPYQFGVSLIYIIK